MPPGLIYLPHGCMEKFGGKAGSYTSPQAVLILPTRDEVEHALTDQELHLFFGDMQSAEIAGMPAWKSLNFGFYLIPAGDHFVLCTSESRLPALSASRSSR